MTDTDTVIDFPADPFTRWRRRFPGAPDTDPREGGAGPCAGDGCQTFAWYGYGGLCGWCWEATR